MQVRAKSKHVRVSPYKLRPLVDAIRGKSFRESQAFLKTQMTKRTKPVLKVLESAYANAKAGNGSKAEPEQVMIKEIFVDQGPTIKYYKPAAMGRASIQRRRLSTITVILETDRKQGEKKA